MKNSTDDSWTSKVSSTSILSRKLHDYGTTTTLYLNVLGVNEDSATALLQRFTLEGDRDKKLNELSSIPAYAFTQRSASGSLIPECIQSI